MIDDRDYDEMHTVMGLADFLDKLKIVSASEKNFERVAYDFCSSCELRYDNCSCDDHYNDWGGTDYEYDYDRAYDQAKDDELTEKVNPVFEAIEGKGSSENNDK